MRQVLVDLPDARRAAKPWLPADDRDVTGGLVRADEHGRPSCVRHGAMNRVDKHRSIWRCSEMYCGVGAEIVGAQREPEPDRRAYAGLRMPAPIRMLKVYRERRTGVAYITTTVRIYGKAQIDTFHEMCAATARQPHELAGDIIVENLWEAGSQPGGRNEARRGRSWRRTELRRHRRAAPGVDDS
jgi:hypothetical protein